MPDSFLTWLQDLRDLYKKPIIINSGTRCAEWNAIVGGKPHSAHIEGLAVDIAIRSSKDRYKIISIAYLLGVHGVGKYATWVHFDQKDRGERIFW